MANRLIMLSSPAGSPTAHPISVTAFFWDSCKIAVFGIGSRSYDSNFNAATKDSSHQMHVLGALAILPLCHGVVVGGDLDEVFEQCSSLVGLLKRYSGGGKMGNFSLALGWRSKMGNFSLPRQSCYLHASCHFKPSISLFIIFQFSSPVSVMRDAVGKGCISHFGVSSTEAKDVAAWVASTCHREWGGLAGRNGWPGGVNGDGRQSKVSPTSAMG